MSPSGHCRDKDPALSVLLSRARYVSVVAIGRPFEVGERRRPRINGWLVLVTSHEAGGCFVFVELSKRADG